LITHGDIDKADLLLREFCQAVEKLYGPDSCTMNLHLHCHIAECLHDYGPAHATWCFSFECYNGVLGDTPNNNSRSLDIEKTIRRFVQQMELGEVLPQYSTELSHFFPRSVVGSLNETLAEYDIYLKQLKCSAALPLSEVIISDELVSPLGEVTEHVVRTEEVLCLTQMYKTVLRDCDVCNVRRLYHRFVRAKLGDKVYSSRMARTDHANYICAHWLCSDNFH